MASGMLNNINMCTCNKQVDPSCPEFESIYRSIEQAMVLKLSSLKLVCNRAAILYLNTFAQKMVHR